MQYGVCYNKLVQTVGDVLKKFNPVQDKYISREFQAYGIYLSEELNDYKHKSLYIKLAKTVHRSILDKALSYCKDARTDTPNKGALFMWRMKKLKEESAQRATPGGKMKQLKDEIKK